LYVFGREPCFGVYVEVLRQGHLPVADLNSHPRQKINSLFYGVILPAREIHVDASAAYVLLDHPRHRGHVAVPRPFRSFRVTILTSALDEARDLGRRPQNHVTVSPGQVDWDEPGTRPHRAINIADVPYEEITIFFLGQPYDLPQPDAPSPLETGRSAQHNRL